MPGFSYEMNWRRPHLVLADAGDVDRVRADDLAEPLDHVLRGERAVGRLLVAQRVAARAGRRAGAHQSAMSARWPAVCSAATARDQLVDDVPGVADDRHVGVPVLADLGRVDVGVDDLRVRGEGVQLAGDPVVEAGAEGDQQVGLLQRVDRARPCRACRACPGAAGGSRGTRRAPSAW